MLFIISFTVLAPLSIILLVLLDLRMVAQFSNLRKILLYNYFYKIFTGLSPSLINIQLFKILI